MKNEAGFAGHLLSTDPLERVLRPIVEGQVRSFVSDHPEVVKAVAWYKRCEDNRTTFVNSVSKRILRDLLCADTRVRLINALSGMGTADARGDAPCHRIVGARMAGVEATNCPGHCPEIASHARSDLAYIDGLGKTLAGTPLLAHRNVGADRDGAMERGTGDRPRRDRTLRSYPWLRMNCRVSRIKASAIVRVACLRSTLGRMLANGIAKRLDMEPVPMAEDELRVLADRCEAATGPDRELDARIWCVVGVGSPYNAENCWLAATVRPPEMEAAGINLSGWLDRYPGEAAAYARSYNVPDYTASLDAAMTLVPEGCTLQMDNVDGPWARIHTPERRHPSPESQETASLPLALCAAALRARAEIERLSVQGEG